MKIELRSAPHRRIAVSDILKNPHRDLNLNPTSPERVEQLLESFDRTGFWDNIVVREHPTREGKYELAYGHNRWEALKDKRVEVSTITIPVAALSDWEMYCAMVDENEMQGSITPAIAMENIGVGCDLIERALKKIGKEGTWADFNEAIGNGKVVPTGTTSPGQAFEQIRNAFFNGEGLGRRFLEDFLPCGHMRASTITTVLNARYAEEREAAKRAQAKIKNAEAKEKARLAKEEKDAKEKRRLEEQAEKAAAEAAKLSAAAEKIGKGKISKDVLLMFDATRTMTDFADAVRKLGIPSKHHKAAANHILDIKVKEERIAKELDIWWDEKSGAAAERRKKAQKAQELEKFRKAAEGKDPADYLLKIASDLRDIEPRIKNVLKHIQTFGPREIKIINDRIRPFAETLNDLLERGQESLSSKDITPAAKKMLSHQKG